MDKDIYIYDEENLIKSDNVNITIFNSGYLTKEGQEYLQRQDEQNKLFKKWIDKGIKIYF